MKRNYRNKKQKIALLLCMALIMMLTAGCGAGESGQTAESDNLEALEEGGVYVTLYAASELEESDSSSSDVSGEIE